MLVVLRRAAVALFLLAAACGGNTSSDVGAATSPAASGGTDATSSGVDPGASSSSSSTSSSSTSSSSSTGGAPPPPSAADGSPSRVACTSSLGPGLTTDHGRLDGYLRAIVGPKDFACHADGTHVHLQVEAKGATFDVAVNVDGLEGETSGKTLPGGAWTEGWHAGVGLDYVNDLGLHATALTTTGISTVRTRVTDALAAANHVTIFATGYGPDGAHLVHRESGGRDGALVVDPLGPSPRVLAFRFEKDTF